MRRFSTLLLIIPLTLLSLRTAAQSLPPVSLPHTEARPIRSAVLGGETYQLLVHFPANYNPARRYDVLYVLDGINAFPAAIDCLGILHGEGDTTYREPLLVAISDGTMIGQPGNKRDRDYTPTAFKTHWGASGGGGGAAFLRFLEQEVMPLVEATYPVTRRRTLYGYSYGGLLAAYALLSKPGLFQTVLMGSPSLWTDDAVMLRRFEPDYARTHTDLPARAWLSVGEQDANLIDDDRAFGAALAGRRYPSLRLETRVLPGLDHLSGIHPTMLQAFRWAFCGTDPAQSIVKP